MRRLKEIINLPIISVFEGNKAGRIKNVVIEPKEGTVKYFLVDDQSMFSVKVVPMGKIMGIGDEALMIETSDLVIDAQKDLKAVELLEKDVTVVGSMVFTKKGKQLGFITEILIDEENGKILGCEIGKDKDMKFLPAESVITYGKEVTIVEHDVHDKLLESIEETLKEKKNETYEESLSVQDTGDIIEKKQKEYLLGRELSKAILVENTVLAHEGQVVTEELIKKMEDHGKFIELTLHVK